ncbi:MAG: hypothetical protein AVDCRST_MAG30-3881, partial [uncultured Solirubrobacteraceae bacterium]
GHQPGHHDPVPARRAAGARRALAARRPPSTAAVLGVAGVDDRRGHRRPGRRLRGELAQPARVGRLLVRRRPGLDDDHLALHGRPRALREQRAHGAEVGRRLLPPARPLLPLRVVRPAAERLGHRVQRLGRRSHGLGDHRDAAAGLGQAAALAAAGLRRNRRRGRAEPPVRRSGCRGAGRAGRRRRGSRDPRPDRRVRDLRDRHQGVRGAVAGRGRRLLRACRVHRGGGDAGTGGRVRRRLLLSCGRRDAL